MPTRPSFSLILIVAILAGCGASTPPQEPSTETTKASPPASEVRSAPAVSASPAVEPITTRTPEEVSRLAVQSLIDAQPEKFWGLLPPSYQGRINKVVQSWALLFADQEMLTASANVLKEMAFLIKEKQEFFLATPALPFHADPEKAKAKWDDLVARINRVADSELFDSLALKKFDGQRVCAGPAADVIFIYNEVIGLLPDDPLTKLQNDLNTAKFEVVETNDKMMTLSLVSGDGKSQTFQYELVEGHWIPQPFVVTFDSFIKQAQESIEKFPKDEVGRSVAGMTGQAEGYLEYLKGLRAIQTQEEFDREMETLVLMFLPGSLIGEPESTVPATK